MRAFPIPARKRVARHSHPWAQFLYADDAALTVTIDSAKFPLPAGLGAWIPPQTSHGVTTREQVDFLSLYVDVENFPEAPKQTRVFSVTPLVREMLREATRLRADYEIEASDGRFMAVLRDRIVALSANANEAPLPRDKRLVEIAAALIENPCDSRSLDAWGETVGASRRHLSRLFHRETGVSFQLWRQNVRLNTALSLLSEGWSVTTVAQQVGFVETSSFIEAFRSRFGVTPGKVKRRKACSP